MDELFSLRDRVAVVTGGSRGIGLAIAHAYAKAGATVVVASRKGEACQAAARAISEQSGHQAYGISTHVGLWDDCERLVDHVYGQFGRCDILVNNAGMSPLYDDLASVTENYWDKVLSVNLKGPFRLSALVGERMAGGDGGSIINVSTIGSLRPGAEELVYACAKAGLNALTIGLAEAFGPKVRANAILPGAILTDIASHWTDEMKETAANCPMGRAGRPDDFVGTALWLASPASAWITGVLLRVDGGAYRQM